MQKEERLGRTIPFSILFETVLIDRKLKIEMKLLFRFSRYLAPGPTARSI